MVFFLTSGRKVRIASINLGGSSTFEQSTSFLISLLAQCFV